MGDIGTLYGVGIGPGDPELLTLKAARILREVDVVFTSTQAKSGKSQALEIARPHLRPGGEVIPLAFSHTFEGVESGRAHRENAQRVLEVLRRPATGAFLTLGDPMTYSTFTYLLAALRKLEPGAPVEVVPGITSFSSAAAETMEALVEGDETLAIVSAARGTQRLREAFAFADAVVVLKPYRRTDEVCDLLETMGLGASAIFSAECSRPSSVLVRGVAAVRDLPRRYMSLFLVRRPKPRGTEG